MKRKLTLKQVNALGFLSDVCILLAATSLYRRSALYGYLILPPMFLLASAAWALALRNGKRRSLWLTLLAAMLVGSLLTILFLQ